MIYYSQIKQRTKLIQNVKMCTCNHDFCNQPEGWEGIKLPRIYVSYFGLSNIIEHSNALSNLLRKKETINSTFLK